MRREQAEALVLAGGELARALVAELVEQVAALRAEVEELKRVAVRGSHKQLDAAVLRSAADPR